MHYVPVFSVKTGILPAVNDMRTFPHHRTGKPAAGRFSAILRLPDRVRDPGRRGYTKHMLRLRRAER